jgi:hypothetical protein
MPIIIPDFQLIQIMMFFSTFFNLSLDLNIREEEEPLKKKKKTRIKRKIFLQREKKKLF